MTFIICLLLLLKASKLIQKIPDEGVNSDFSESLTPSDKI